MTNPQTSGTPNQYSVQCRVHIETPSGTKILSFRPCSNESHDKMLRLFDCTTEASIEVSQDEVMAWLENRGKREAGSAMHEALENLIRQIDINDFVDSHGHEAKNLQALHEARAILREIDNGENRAIESPAHHIIAKIDGAGRG